jgi:cytoskeleton protein RodZ
MTETDTPQPVLVSVGDKLKSLREARNISALEVASKMHLDIRVINAIEDDDYHSLPDPIYIRGYIRSYSKLVGGDSDEMVRLFEHNVGVQEPEIIPEIKFPSQSSSSDKPVKAFTYLITLGLVVLLIAWWQSNFVIDIHQDTDSAVVAAPNTSVNTELVEQRLPVQASSYTPQIPLQNPVQIPIELLDIDQFRPESLEDMGGDLVSADDLDNADENNLLVSTPEQAGTSIEPAPTPPATTSLSTLVQTDGPDLLKFSLTADSWIEITDVNNQKLFMDLARTGTTLDLRGTAPFDILLGFAPGVTLEFNGAPFDIAPYSRAGVAKFRLAE